VTPFLQRIKDYLYPPSQPPTLALTLSGGGARSAYQAGVLRYVAETFPGLYFPVMTGVSAGAINMAQIANHVGTLDEAAHRLEKSWRLLDVERVFEIESGFSILWRMIWNNKDIHEERPISTADVRQTHGLLDTTPLWHFLHDRLNAEEGRLHGVDVNLADGRLHAAAVITTSYTTGQTVTWVQGDDFDVWERANRVSYHTQLTVDHVMASTAIPLVFPAVRIDNGWYGDGGIRLSAPLAPAVHLGAQRILAISNNYARSRAEADQPSIHGYPPTAQIVGLLMNAIFADALDQDAHTLERVNRLVDELPAHRRKGMRPIELLRIRPSVDLSQLGADYKARLPSSVRFLTNGLGAGETREPDWLSVLLFLPEYVDRLLDIGFHDARDRHHELVEFFDGVAEPDGLGGDRAASHDRIEGPVGHEGDDERSAPVDSSSDRL